MTNSPRYRDAGVDIEAASRAVGSIEELISATRSSADTSQIGHFGGVYKLPSGGDRLLVASADGVGTKLMLAIALGDEAHAQIGSDLVCHCVNDLLACGARPLFFLDYFSCGHLEQDVFTSVVRGMTSACVENGVALIGGETAEMPGLYADEHYDLAGFIVGEVAPDRFVDGSQIAEGDVLLGLPSTGLHTNGYSLARSVIELTGNATADAALLRKPIPGLADQALADLLMAKHPSYLADVMPLLERNLVRGMAHITGGGLIDNVPRMLPDGLAARFDPSTWTVPIVFEYLIRHGDLPLEECYRAFNMGIGFVLAARKDDAPEILNLVPDAKAIGAIEGRKPDAGPVLGLVSGRALLEGS